MDSNNKKKCKEFQLAYNRASGTYELLEVKPSNNFRSTIIYKVELPNEFKIGDQKYWTYYNK